MTQRLPSMWLEFIANLIIVAQVAAIANYYVQIMRYMSRVDIENQRIEEQMEDLYMDLSDAPGLHYD